MKKSVYFLGLAGLAAAAVFLIQRWLDGYADSGYVWIGFGFWSLETSFVFFALAQIVVFFIFYVLLRLLGVCLRLPKKIKNKGKDIRLNRSQDALISGLTALAEGNWETAEKTLIKHATNSDAPLLYYLSAARAAQARGAITKRDEYLSVAAEQAEESKLAVGLTQAELQLASEQFNRAMETLIGLQSIDASHISVLKMLHQVYTKMGNWEALCALIPALLQHKILLADGAKSVEIETFVHLLKEVAEQGDSDAIQTLWQSIPKPIQSVSAIAAAYYTAMIELGLGATVEQAIVAHILKNWDEALLVLYAEIDTGDDKNQLQTVEQWLPIHSGSAVLLGVLGKICNKCYQLEKAEQYLIKSLALNPSVPTYQMLGDVLSKKGDKEMAGENYKKGLELASGIASNADSSLAKSLQPEPAES